MSNTAVGPVYAQIIERIIEAAKNDFEEGGYDQSTLTDLKERWQQNLSNLRVAQCPWDPPPQQQQPQQTMSNATTIPSSAMKTEPSPVTPSSSLPHPIQNGTNSGAPHIKQEPKYDPGSGSFPATGNYGPPGMTQMAQQRASHLLQQQFGSQANASIQAAGLHQQTPRAQLPTGQRSQQVQMPGPGQPRPPVPQYSQQQQSSLSTAQTDGSGDDVSDQWSAHVALTQADGEHSRTWVDGLLRAHLDESIAKTDSGLMVPLSEQPHLRNKKRKVLRQHLADLSLAEASLVSTSSTHPTLQVDGVDDDDDDDDDDDKDDIKAKVRDDDEDAINSDLDDDEEEDRDDNNENGEGPVGETILCTYDKVQRVKNKWKCTLKDGILTTGGKEYVFHKANGEFEW